MLTCPLDQEWSLEARLKYCQEFLARGDIDDRFDEICEPYPELADNVYECYTEYRDWISHHGNKHLLLAGDVGAGKSTLLKSMARSMAAKAAGYPSAISLSYFFQRPKAGRLKTIDHMSRTLLYQLLPSHPVFTSQFATSLRAKSKDSLDPVEPLGYLPQQLSRALAEVAIDCRIRVFIDIYEMSDYKVVEEFLHYVPERMREDQDCFRTCISTWTNDLDIYVPANLLQELKKPVKMFVEDGQKLYIQTYIDEILGYKHHHIFRYGWNYLIANASRGRFLYAGIAAQWLLESSRQGVNVDSVKRVVSSMPDRLHDLYELSMSIVVSAKRVETERLLQWLLYSPRPLSQIELYEAMRHGSFDISGSPVMFEFPDLSSDYDTLSEYLASYSCGFAELRTIQNGLSVFLKHKSIEKYLSSGSIFTRRQSAIPAVSAAVAYQNGHFYLAEVCSRYLKQASQGPEAWTAGRSVHDFPFLEYAASSFLFHLESSCSDSTNLLRIQTLVGLPGEDVVEQWAMVCSVLREDGGAEVPGYSPTGVAGTRLLHIIAQCGLMVYLKEHAEALQDQVNSRNARGWTPLTCAAYWGRVLAIHELVAWGAELDAGDEFLRTPLFWAVAGGSVEAIKWLLARGAAVDFRNDSHETPLFDAAANGHVEQAKVLLDYGAAVDAGKIDGGTPLMAAAWNGQYDMAVLLLESGAYVNAREKLGRSVLYSAVSRGHSRVVSLLIEHGADVDTSDSYGRSMLIEAVVRRHTDVVRVLLRAGAWISMPSETGKSAFELAEEAGDLATIMVILDHEKQLKEDEYIYNNIDR